MMTMWSKPDDRTGLPKVPDNFRWKVRKDRLMGKNWICVLLQKKVGPFRATVNKGSSHGYGLYSTAEDLAYKYFSKAEIKADKKRTQDRIKSLYGTYPPKRFDGSY